MCDLIEVPHIIIYQFWIFRRANRINCVLSWLDWCYKRSRVVQTDHYICMNLCSSHSLNCIRVWYEERVWCTTAREQHGAALSRSLQSICPYIHNTPYYLHDAIVSTVVNQSRPAQLSRRTVFSGCLQGYCYTSSINERNARRITEKR